MRNNNKKIIKGKYKEIASRNISCGCSCGCDSGKKTAREIGYSEEDLEVAGDANLGLGCGNPLGFGEIGEGDTVLDLGSGAGVDAILAAKKVGNTGKVIGVDMTEEMVKKARENAKEKGVNNAEFLMGDIENLPLGNEKVDIITTNCVVNLTSDKNKAFSEAYRVLKSGGKIYLSDIVLLEELSEEQRKDEDLLAGCVAGALLKEEYLKKIEEAGFKINILEENKEISEKQYGGISLESITVELTK